MLRAIIVAAALSCVGAAVAADPLGGRWMVAQNESQHPTESVLREIIRQLREGTVHRALVVRQGHEIVRGPLEQQATRRRVLGDEARHLFRGVMQKAHLGDSGDSSDDLRERALDLMQSME